MRQELTRLIPRSSVVYSLALLEFQEELPPEFMLLRALHGGSANGCSFPVTLKRLSSSVWSLSLPDVQQHLGFRMMSQGATWLLRLNSASCLHCRTLRRTGYQNPRTPPFTRKDKQKTHAEGAIHVQYLRGVPGFCS